MQAGLPQLLDLRSLALITGMLGGCLGVVMVQVSLNRKVYPGFHDFTAGFVVGALGFLALSLRDLLPDAVSIVVANAMIMSHWALMDLGLLSFAGRKTTRAPLAVALVLDVVIMSYFTFFAPNLEWRIYVSSVFLGGFSLWGAWLAAGPVARVLGGRGWLLPLTLGAQSLWFWLRIPLTLHLGVPGQDFMHSGTVQGLTMVVVCVGNVLCALGLVIINSQRLEAELSQARRQIGTLEGLLPICSSCGDIRDGQGQWRGMEEYLSQNTRMAFAHGICPRCVQRFYPDLVVPAGDESPGVACVCAVPDVAAGGSGKG